jgi:ribosomal protein L6P/L9E
MLFRKNKKLLSDVLDFYYSPRGYFYVSGPLGVISNKLFFNFDFDRLGIKRNLKSSSFKHFFSCVNFAINSVVTGYYVFIDMVGLGYKLKKITSSVYRFYVGQSHYIYFYVPSDILV